LGRFDQFMSFVRLTTDGTAEAPTMFPRVENGARGSHRRVVMTTCQAHGAAGFMNLLVAKEHGTIVLNAHVANCCVIRLDEQAARALLDILGEWLG
jgi:hypothetical protein